MAREISFESLFEELDGLEYHIEQASSSIENILEMFDRVNKMTQLLKKQIDELEEKKDE